MEQLTINPKAEKFLSRLSGQGFDIPKSQALPLREVLFYNSHYPDDKTP